MVIDSVVFKGSFEMVTQCPQLELPEYAFIGRSNVGKSSLINMLCQKKGIAKVSNTPGKTQTINYFLINDSWHLVDLPGYGFAKISKKTRAKWEQMIERYMLTRNQLACVFILIDARHPLQKIDLEFINWMGERQIPFSLVFTKIDKVKTSQQHSHVQRILDELLEHWFELPQHFVTSAEKGQGREEILSFIEEINNNC